MAKKKPAKSKPKAAAKRKTPPRRQTKASKPPATRPAAGLDRNAEGQFKDGNGGGPGGPRPGAGRPSSEATRLRDKLLSEGDSLLEELKGLRKEKSAHVRYNAVEYSLNQAIGKPTQRVQVEDTRSTELFDALDEALGPLERRVKDLAKKAKAKE